MGLQAIVNVLFRLYRAGRPHSRVPRCGSRAARAGRSGRLLSQCCSAADADPGASAIRALFQTAAAQTREAFDHQAFPFDQLVGELDIRRDLSRSPLFDVMLILQNQDEPGFDTATCGHGRCSSTRAPAGFDLTFSCKALSAGLILGIEYNADLFCEGRIRRMGGHFAQFVGAAPSPIRRQPCAVWNMLPEDERIQLIEGGNARRWRTRASRPWSTAMRQRRRRPTRWR